VAFSTKFLGGRRNVVRGGGVRDTGIRNLRKGRAVNVHVHQDNIRGFI